MDKNADSQSATLTFQVRGDLVGTNVETLRSEINVLMETWGRPSPGWKTFSLDLSATRVIDFPGFNLVVGLFKHVRKQGAKMQVVYSSPNVLRTFRFTRMDKHIVLVKV
jgi:anti-anti-sigma factor